MNNTIILIAAFSFGWNTVLGSEPASSPPRSQQSPMSDLSVQVKEKAELAVEQFQDRAGGKLDYSVASLSMVEEMLAEAASFRSQMPQKDQKALVELFGSYILMVAYKEHGGKFYWFEERPQPVLVVGEPAFHVAILTFDKVRGRLGGDEGDNIPFFYEGFSDRVGVATPGTHATYL